MIADISVIREAEKVSYAAKFRQQWDADVAHLHSLLGFSVPHAARFG